MILRNATTEKPCFPSGSALSGVAPVHPSSSACKARPRASSIHQTQDMRSCLRWVRQEFPLGVQVWSDFLNIRSSFFGRGEAPHSVASAVGADTWVELTLGWGRCREMSLLFITAEDRWQMCAAARPVHCPLLSFPLLHCILHMYIRKPLGYPTDADKHIRVLPRSPGALIRFLLIRQLLSHYTALALVVVVHDRLQNIWKAQQLDNSCDYKATYTITPWSEQSKSGFAALHNGISHLKEAHANRTRFSKICAGGMM